MGTEDASKLFVAGLPDGITEEALRALFTGAGSQVEQLSLPRDRATGKPRGFAFVTLSSPEQAEAARGRLDGTLVDGRSITVRPFSSEPPQRRGPGDGPPGPRGPGGGPGRFQDTSDRTLYVGNLPYDASEAEVRELFSSANTATPQRLHLPTDPTGRPRGFGFVTFATAEEANNAITATRDAAVRGRRCVIHIAHKKGERPDRPPGGPGGFSGGPRPRGPDMAEVWLATQGGGERRRRGWGAPGEGEPEVGGSSPSPGGPSLGGGGPPPRSKKRKGGEGERGGGRPKPKERGGAGRMRRDDDDY